MGLHLYNAFLHISLSNFLFVLPLFEYKLALQICLVAYDILRIKRTAEWIQRLYFNL